MSNIKRLCSLNKRYTTYVTSARVPNNGFLKNNAPPPSLSLSLARAMYVCIQEIILQVARLLTEMSTRNIKIIMFLASKVRPVRKG
jgi:hypothetical protein